MSTNSKIKAVIWDMGGVLLRTEDRGPRIKLAEKFNMTYEQLEALVFSSFTALAASTGQVSEQAHWLEVGRQLELDDQGISEFQDAFWGGDRMDYSLLAYIDQLRPAFSTGLLSNAWSDAREKLDGKYDFLRVFDMSIFSAETGLAKPDAKIYQLALDRLGVKPEEAVFIDDFKINISGAQAVGMHAIRYISREQAITDLQQLIGG